MGQHMVKMEKLKSWGLDNGALEKNEGDVLLLGSN